MFGFGNSNSKKDDSKLGFGIPSLSFGNSRGALGKASDALTNTGEKVENFIFGHHKSNAEIHTESSATENSALRFGLPGLSLGNAGGVLGKASNTLKNTEEKVEDFLFGHHTENAEIHTEASRTDSSAFGIGLPSLSLGNARGVLGKSSNTLKNTEEKVEDFLFGHHTGNAEIHTQSSRGIFGLGGNSGISLGLNAGANNVPNLPRGGSISGNIGSIAKNDTSLSISLDKGNLPKVALPKSNFGASISLPNLSNVGTRAKNDLEKVGGAIENTGRKAIHFLFGSGDKSPTLPELSLSARNGSLDLKTPTLDVSMSRKNNSKIGAPNIELRGKSNLGIDLTNVPHLPNLQNVSNEVGNVGKKAIGILLGEGKERSNIGLPLGGKNELNLNKTSSLQLPIDQEKRAKVSVSGGLGTVKSNATSVDLSMGEVSKLPSIHVSLPKPSGMEHKLKDNLPKMGSTIINNGKKATDGIFGTGKVLPTLPLAEVKTNVNTNTSSIGVPFGGNENDTIPKIPPGKERNIVGSSNAKPVTSPEKSFPRVDSSLTGESGGVNKANNISFDNSLDKVHKFTSKSTELKSEKKNYTTSLGNMNLTDAPPLLKLGTTTSNFLTEVPSTDIPTTKTAPIEKHLSSSKNFNGKSMSVRKNISKGKETQTSSPNFSQSTTGTTFSTNKGNVLDGNVKSTTTNEASVTSTLSTDFSQNPSNNEIDMKITSSENSLNFKEGGFEGTKEANLAPHNMTTESERTLKKIEDTLRGWFVGNSATSQSSTGTTSRNEENHVTEETVRIKETTDSEQPAHNTISDYVYSKYSTTAKSAKSVPVVIPPFFLVPNKNISLGEQFLPELPPSVFDNPTGKKTPFIPVLPPFTDNPMGIYNLTDRGVNSNSVRSQTPNSLQQSDDLSAVTYGAIGVGSIAIISIIIALIYKAIKKASSSSAGGSYSPKSQHTDKNETRKSSSSSEENGEKSALGSEPDSNIPDEHTIITQAVINETSAQRSFMKKNTINVTSKAPAPEQEKTPEVNNKNLEKKDMNNKEGNNNETSKTNLTLDSQEHRKEQVIDTLEKNPTESEEIVHEPYVTKKNAHPINKPPRKVERVINCSEKFTSDKTAASNLNENSLRSLGHALGGILKNQIPEGNQNIEGVKRHKEVKDFGADSDELLSSTPPTTPTDLSDQEITKNDKQVEDHTGKKKSNVIGGDAEGDAFFSSGETELDTGSEYFSADESSYVAKDSTIDIKSTHTVIHCQTIISNSMENQENQNSREKDVYDNEFVLEDGRKKSIEEDIAHSLSDSSKHRNEDGNITEMNQPKKEKLIDIANIDVHTRQRGITMCEDLLIDMEVHEILEGKEPYEVPSDNSPVEEDEKRDEYIENCSMQSNANNERRDSVSHETRERFKASDEVILQEIRLHNLPRNTPLQYIIKPGETSQSYSGLDADSVVNGILKTSKLVSTDTKTIQNDSDTIENVISIEKNESKKINYSNVIDDNSFFSANNRESSKISSTTEITLEKKTHDTVDMRLGEMKDNITERIEYVKENQINESLSSGGTNGNAERNLIDFIVPKNELISSRFKNEKPFLDEKVTLREEQGVTTQENFGQITDDFEQGETQGAGQTCMETPKWYIPFESSGQEPPDPRRGNSDGLYIALSEETVLSQMAVETERPHHSTCKNQSDRNIASGSPKKSWTYIAINEEPGSMNEGWPSHLPRNIHDNNVCGLGCMKPASGETVAIQEEETQPDSTEVNTVSSKASKSVTTSQIHFPNNQSELSPKQLGDPNIKPTLGREKTQGDIPAFELPNMDKRLMKKKKLRRRQIKSLDSGVHSYYGEYIDLVEFPELESAPEMIRNEEQKTSSSDGGNQNNRNACIPSNIKELEIEEDVVTILPDGTIREEKIIIDKISST